MTTVCYLCSRVGDTTEKYCHQHHIYEGKNRQASDRAGFYIYVCPQHHRETHRTPKLNKWLKEQTQRDFEREHTREEFMRIIGRNYL